MVRSELYIGNLNKDVTSRDIESVFRKHGKVLRCEVKNKGYGPVYAFIEFDDERDAEDALNHENGKDMLGSSMVVEFTKGKGRRGFNDRGGGGYRGGGGGGGPRRDVDCYECGERGHFARDCPRRGGGRGGGGGGRGGGGYRDRSRDRGGRRDRSRDRSRDRGGRRDRSRDRSRERSNEKRQRPSSRDRDRSKSSASRSRTRSRSRSPSYNNKSDHNGSDHGNTNGNHHETSMD